MYQKNHLHALRPFSACLHDVIPLRTENQDAIDSVIVINVDERTELPAKRQVEE